MGQLWNKVTVPAWNDGYCEYAMDQMLLPGAVGDGTCFGLAALWLKKFTQGKDYACDGNYEVRSVSDMPLAVQVQKTFDKEILAHDEPWPAITAALAHLDFKIVFGYAQRSESGVGASGLYNIINAGGSGAKGGLGGYIVGLRSNTGAAHAFAIVNADDTWHMFDANYGRFKVPDETFWKSHVFQNFLVDYMKSGKSGYTSRYNGGWLTCRVWPRSWG
ncbi:YopT-type cysteine protease domain-containing protein [Plastoroseomonas hellenica]|uniref:YopT-type cysteine protease domain-containing protein n=1 Tax=Plastoroseomonas hellenica TaxID=2687306 RepID=UPI001BAD891A|nr:YopT-type cysteine protease domain-containing protein [Plastoroseomonas hellenica]MBR0647147.1 hypothetical protein [Plastoroseomonas hellenica]